MAGSTFSQNWFRVAGLRPRLRAHARIHRQPYRGADWYLVQDDQTGRFHRISPAANHLVGLMNGHRTVEEIWRATIAWLGPEATPPTQDDVIRLLAQLHAADLLASDRPPDLDELAHRAGDRAQKAVMARLRNPLALRFPLIDPDRFLEATLPLARPFFTVWGLLLWLGVVGAGAVIAVLHWEALGSNVLDRVLIAENLVLMAVLYPLVKAIHELGHGYAAKVWGGRVHEMGLMLLVLIPVPYVDASSAYGFQSKWQRAVVGGAGILVELFLAGLALIVWASVEPGLVRAGAFNVALIAGVSTLLFNGNPLLRFDGYYVLSDLIEIPNLAARANRHVMHLIKRHAFGLPDSISPATATGEPAWFVVYAVLAFVYRLAIMVSIALFIASQAFVLGIVLAVWAVWTALIWPPLKGLWWLWDSPELGPRRGRAMAVTGIVAGAIGAAVAAIPLPFATTASGVVWMPEAAHVRAGVDGFVTDVVAAADSHVEPGTLLLRLDDPILRTRLRVLEAQRAETAVRLAQEAVRDRAQEEIMREQLGHLDRAVALLESRLAALTVQSPRAGRFVGFDPEDAVGRHVRRGDLVGYVIAPGDAVVRAVVPETEVDLIQSRVEAVAVVLAAAVDRPVPAGALRQVPKAQAVLPSAALGTAGGGDIALDPNQAEAPTALEPVFQFDVEVSIPPEAAWIGMRAHVRIDHGTATLAERLWRQLRQLFLRQFDV